MSVGWTKLISARIRMTQLMMFRVNKNLRLQSSATYDVESRKLWCLFAKNCWSINTRKMLRILVALICVKYIFFLFFGFIEALDLKRILNKLRIDGMHWHRSFNFVTKNILCNLSFLRLLITFSDVVRKMFHTRVIFGGTKYLWKSYEMYNPNIQKYWKFIALVSAREPSNLIFAELPASAWSLTSKQTALYRSALDRLSKCVGH